jgi:TRAP-type C4-dicarboxylate transport system permease small subunit
MIKIVHCLENSIEKFVDWLSIFLFASIGLLGLFSVIMRYAFRLPIIWSEELMRYIYIWLGYLGWIVATRNNSHIQITGFIQRLPQAGQKCIKTFTCILVVLFSFFMIRYGIQMTEAGARMDAMTLPISFALVYIMAPIANTVILLYQLRNLVNIWKKPLPASEGGPV